MEISPDNVCIHADKSKNISFETDRIRLFEILELMIGEFAKDS